MLSAPDAGWTDFRLSPDDPTAWSLSYTDDLPNDWLDQAIHGLETLLPFCVKGFLEPGRLLCVVSYWNCIVMLEDDENRPLSIKDLRSDMETCHTSMLDFCRRLEADIRRDLDLWADFYCSLTGEHANRRAALARKLDRLRRLIAQREQAFGPGCCFL